MFMKNGKKKTHPLLAIGIGALAFYGAYSMVHCVKQTCCERVQMLTKVLKNKNKNNEIAQETTAEEG